MKNLYPFFLLTLIAISLTIPLTQAQETPQYTIIWYSDTQNMSEFYPETLTNAFNLTNNITSDFFILTGDCVNDMTNNLQWTNFNNAWQLITTPKMAVTGNHDIYNGGNPYEPNIPDYTAWNNQFGTDMLNWTYTLGNNLFIGFNIGDRTDNEKLTWLDQQVTNNPTKNIYILTHWGTPYETELQSRLTGYNRQIFNLFGHNSPTPDTALLKTETNQLISIMSDPQRYETNGGNGYFTKIQIYETHITFTQISQIEEYTGTEAPYYYDITFQETTTPTTPTTSIIDMTPIIAIISTVLVAKIILRRL